MRITIMDADESKFYKKVMDFLVIKMGFDPSTPTIILTSGDNSVVMKGELAGHSLREMKEYIAKVEGKKIEYDNEDYY